MKKIIVTTVILIFSSVAHAEWKKLVCTDSENFTVVIEFNEELQAARLINDEIFHAVITEESIYFKSKFRDGKTYIHRINRTNGILIVRLDSKSGVDMPPYYCKKFDVRERKF